jgi:hypothetical protein
MKLEAIGCRFHDPMHGKVKAHGPLIGDEDTAARPCLPAVRVLQFEPLLFPFGHCTRPDRKLHPLVLARPLQRISIALRTR